MDKIENDPILDAIDEATAEEEDANEIPHIESNDEDIEDEKNDAHDPNKIYVKLDPVENIAECMSVAVEGKQIHEMILQFVRIDNTFSLELRGKTPEESQKIFTDKCIAIYKKRSLLEPYIEKVMISILENGDFNYSKKLPRLLLMASYYKKNKDPNKETKYYKLTDLDEEGNYIISKNFEKVVKVQSLKNRDFALEFIIDLWTKRMLSETSFEVLKKKIQKFLKRMDWMQDLKTQLDSYLIYQEQLAKEEDILRQHVAKKHMR